MLFKRTQLFLAQIKMLARLCLASYDDTTTTGDYRLVSRHDYRNIQAVIYESPSHAVVCFRGSDDVIDYGYSLCCWSTPFHKLGRVHWGYARQLANIYDNTLAQAVKAIVKPFHVVGHSLGGALAFLLSTLVYDRPNFVACVTYGAPKCCDRHVVLNTLGLVHWRYVTPRDPVPRLFFGYRHSSSARKKLGGGGHTLSSYL